MPGDGWLPLIAGALIAWWFARARGPMRRVLRPGCDPVRFATPRQRRALWRRQKGLCAYCRLPLRGAVEAHVPRDGDEDTPGRRRRGERAQPPAESSAGGDG